MTGDWLIARFEVGGGREWAWAEPLMAKLGLDPQDFRPQVTLSTGPVLRLSRFVRVDGEKTFDLNLNAPVTEPVVVPIAVTDLPPWLIPEE